MAYLTKIYIFYISLGLVDDLHANDESFFIYERSLISQSISS